MTSIAVVAGLVLAVVLWRVRRRKAARSVAADGVAVALSGLVPADSVLRHRAPATRRRWSGSGGSM